MGKSKKSKAAADDDDTNHFNLTVFVPATNKVYRVREKFLRENQVEGECEVGEVDDLQDEAKAFYELMVKSSIDAAHVGWPSIEQQAPAARIFGTFYLNLGVFKK
jgi:hypothetical protein